MTVTPELEAMARAIFDDDFGDGADVARWQAEHPDVRDAYISNARAALLAIREPIIATAKARRAIYAAKAAKVDPLAEDSCNRHELLTHAVEAMEYAEADLAAAFNAILGGTDS
jgi:hypothetical protein